MNGRNIGGRKGGEVPSDAVSLRGKLAQTPGNTRTHLGGGGAGLAAAVSASNEGASVILIEKTGFLGGDNPWQLYLTAGTHRIRLEVVQGEKEAQAAAMQAAASNDAGAMTGFMGMNMAGNAMGGGFNQAQSFYQMGMQQQQQQAASAPAADGWKCGCGATATGKFCPECGSRKPEPANGWKCGCGATATGKFCPECGAKKPAGAPLYRCDKCGWTLPQGQQIPKFCPQCGDPVDFKDMQ